MRPLLVNPDLRKCRKFVVITRKKKRLDPSDSVNMQNRSNKEGWKRGGKNFDPHKTIPFFFFTSGESLT